jgi:excinuclease UvrABC ATPase subunit
MSLVTELASILNTSLSNAVNRAVRMKLTPICSRCGGSGHYSYNQINGTTCFGCAGLGHSTEVTEATLRAAQEAVDDGRLQAYIAMLNARSNCKNARDRVMKAWRDTGISEAYKWQEAAKGVEPHVSISKINKKMCDAYDRVADASFARNIDWIAFEVVINEALDTIREAAKEIPK